MCRNIYILDSTLRDGGYCNNWEFGVENKKRIIKSLMNADVDIIECGLLSKGTFSIEQSKYSDIEELSETLPDLKKNEQFVVLINYGDFDVVSLPECENTNIDGIRLAFHKKDLVKVKHDLIILKEKKYKVYMQPMVTTTYSLGEYVELITMANEIKPYAFYIVDSFGSMKAEELKKYCELANYLLEDSIVLGFHSHNNLQLAYSNAQLFVKEVMNRTAIIDCCIMGMGRGAGNLNTELFLNYLNLICGKSYKIEPILLAIDEIINYYYQKKYWGYSLPNYLSATHNVHPNYASFLADKNTLTIPMINELLSLISIEKKNIFDKKYMEDLYISYMLKKSIKNKEKSFFKEIFCNKEVLIIAPGKSIDIEIDKICTFLNENEVCVISINFDFKVVKTDYIFVSNSKRYDELVVNDNSKFIVTSNIETDGNCLIANYFELLCDEDYVRDNATMMLIKLLINSGVSRIYLAGVDGYSKETIENYTKYSNEFVTSAEYMELLNNGMNKMLHKYMKKVDIKFVTTERKIRR